MFCITFCRWRGSNLENHMATPETPKIAGYNNAPDPARILALNRSKAVQELLARLVDDQALAVRADPRLVSIAKTHFELGFLALGKAIMQPGRLTDAEIAPHSSYLESLAAQAVSE